MVLKPNTLVVGSSYTFSLSAAYVWPERRRRLQEDDATDTSSASISFLVNNPPSGGTFEVSPTEGKWQSEFTVWFLRVRCLVGGYLCATAISESAERATRRHKP